MNEQKKSPSSKLFTLCGIIILLCALLLLGSALLRKLQASEMEVVESGSLSTTLIPDDVSDYLFSPAYKAAMEWEAYQRGYDPDGSKLNSAIGTEEIGQGYTLYRVYTSDMAGSLDSISASYGLILNRTMTFCYSAAELYGGAGTGEFLPSGSDCVGYLYDSGSFHVDSSFRGVSYRFDLQKKNSFAEAVLLTPTPDDEQWVYISHGKPMLLSLGSEHCLIHTALRDSYLTVTVPEGAADAEGNGISGAFLESLTDSIYWDRIEG